MPHFSRPPEPADGRDLTQQQPVPEDGQPHRARRRGRISDRARGGGAQRPGQRSSSRAMFFAVAVHVVIVLALVQWLTFGHGVRWGFFDQSQKNVEERLVFVDPGARAGQVAQAESPRAESPRVERDLRQLPASPLAPQIRAPDQVPAEVAPVAPLTPAVPRDTGSGGAAGVGAPDPNVRGVSPTYNDGRVWNGLGGGGGGGRAPLAAPGVVRGDGTDGLDSIMAGAIMAARDSVDSLARARGQTGRAPGDWTTTDKNGNKWGWDQGGIRLGKVTIPNALLALLPLNAATAANMSGNMSRMDADRRLAASREDIQRMSERTLGEAEFKRVLTEMDQRRDTERRERLRAPNPSIAAPVKTPERVGGSNKRGDR